MIGLPDNRGLDKGDLILSPFYQARNGLGVVTARRGGRG